MSLFCRIPVVVLFLVACAGSLAEAADSPTGESARQQPDNARVEALIARLEDSGQRQQLIESLRLLVQADDAQAGGADGGDESVKTAAAEALGLLARRVSDAARKADALLDNLKLLPTTVAEWAADLRDPERRRHWLNTAMRLIVVLGNAFVVAALVTRLVRRLRRRSQDTRRPGLTRRVLRLSGRMVVDLLPVLAFALTSYALLATIDAGHETRLVAVALINASIISRLVLALSAFLVSPEAPWLRLWRIGDETAHYIQLWIKRLTFVSVYGFFVLQAALLLGLHADVYDLLLHLLGAVVLALLMILIAQSRDEVARVIAAEPPAGSDQPRQLVPVRRAVARVWHLVAGLYLVVVYAIWMMDVEHGARFVLQATAASLAVLAVALLLLRAVDRAFGAGLRLSDELHSRFPGLEQRLNRYFPLLRKALKTVVFALAALLIVDAWGLDALGWLIDGSGSILLGALINIVVILVVAVALWELASGAIERLLADDGADGGHSPSPRVRTLLTVGRNALLVVLTLVSTLMVLSELGINIAPLLAGAGVVGLAVGFGAQRLVQDVITGVFILFQDLMAVGDVVKLGDKAGVVEALSIRTVRLRDLAGVVHTIPFSAIEGVSNLTRDFSFHVFEIGIAYREDVDAVIALLKDIGEELRADPELQALVLEPIEVFGLDAFGDSAIVIKGRIKTRPLKQWQVGRAFNRLVKLRFDEHGIEIPFPHRTLYFGQDKDGSAPPAFVQLESLLRNPVRDAGSKPA